MAPPEPVALDILQNVPFPSKFEIAPSATLAERAEEWSYFSKVWANYEKSSRLITHPADQRLATMLTCFGRDAMKVYGNLKFDNAADKSDITKVIEKLDCLLVGEYHEVYESYVFNKRDQLKGEPVDSFVTDILDMSKHCNYGELTDRMVRDRIVVGTNCSRTRDKLMNKKNLTLSDAISVAKTFEATAAKLKEMENSEEVNAVGNDDWRKAPRECNFCGKNHPMEKRKCPAWGRQCTKCKRQNHFAVKCQSQATATQARSFMPELRPSRRNNPKKKRVDAVDTMSYREETSDDEYQQVFTIENVNTVYPNKLYAMMKLSGERDVKFQMDCGATVNIIPLSIYRSLVRAPSLQPSDVILRTYDNSLIKVDGKIVCKTINQKNGRKYMVEYQIVGVDHKPILGAKAILAMGLMSINTENVMSVSSKAQVNLKEMYPDVFDGKLGKFAGAVKLEVDPEVSPVCLPPRRLPIAIKDDVKKHIDDLVKKGVLIPVNTPTDWTSCIVVVKKENGSIRLCIDPKPLNKALKRNQHPLPTLDDILPDLSEAKFFTVADVKNGYWHCELTEESSYLTTITTPFGRYRWSRAPFGVKPSGDEFARKLNENIEGLEGVRAVADDIIIWGKTEEEHDRNVHALLRRCSERNIKLNHDKLKHKQPCVKYMGHYLTNQGLEADPKKLEAIQKMPAPTDKQGILRVLGTCNYLQQFAPGLSETSAPLRDLLKKDSAFLWDVPQQSAFEELKRKLSAPPVLRYFDPNLPVTLQCDASQRGLGAAIMQKGQPVAMASRAMTSTEQNYAQIEKELLAIVFGTEKFEQYTYGRKVLVESDHKPLEAITKKSLVCAPKRLQRMLLRLQRYDLDIVYKKGTLMYLADTLSRAYLPDIPPSEVENEVESIHMIDYVMNISEESVLKIKEAMKIDPTMTALLRTILHGWPETIYELPSDVADYYTFRDELTIQDGLIFKGDRIVIPQSIRPEMVKKLHASHMGLQSCLRRARETVYWPGLTKDVTLPISTCSICKQFQPAQQKEPLISHETPNIPWAKVGVDLFECDGLDYMVTVDYFSGFFEVDRMNVNKKADEVILKLKAHFARHGIPRQLCSDNGPPYNSAKFEDFAHGYEFEHITSSPRYAQSNGKAESAVKIAKTLIAKAHKAGADVHLALLDYYNTPTEALDSSPAQRLFSRRTRTIMPTSDRLLQPSIPLDVKDKMVKKKLKSQVYYNQATKELDTLHRGEMVRIQDRDWAKGTVLKQCDIRSYRVRTEDGGIYRRNRRSLRRTDESSNTTLRTTAERPPVLPFSLSGQAVASPHTAGQVELPSQPPSPYGPKASAIEKMTTNGNTPNRPMRPQRERVSTKSTIYKDFVTK